MAAKKKSSGSKSSKKPSTPKLPSSAIAQGSDDAKARLKDFLEKRGKKVLRG